MFLVYKSHAMIPQNQSGATRADLRLLTARMTAEPFHTRTCRRTCITLDTTLINMHEPQAMLLKSTRQLEFLQATARS